MPTITKSLTLTVTAEQFVEACSDIELQEVCILVFNRLKRLEAAMEAQREGSVKTYSREAKIIIENIPKINDAKRLDNI